MKRSKEKTSHQTPEVNQLIEHLNEKFGTGSIMNLGDGPPEPVDVTPSGSVCLDRALGTGGYPRGRIIEIFGPESSGKTTLTLHAIASVQARGGVCAFIDAEHAFDPRYAESLGIDLKKLLVAQPDCGEQGLDITGALVESGAVELVVVDSVAALVPKAEIDGDMSDQHMGLHARLMSRGVRKITGDASRTKTTVLFINQLRQKIGVVFGNPETTTGGQALRFFASVRLDVRRVGKVTAGDQTIGNRTRVKVVKNKLAPPFQEAEFDIRWGSGVDNVGELLDLGLEAAVIRRAGSYLSFNGENLGQGRDKARESLLANPALLERLTSALDLGSAVARPSIPESGTATEEPHAA